MVIQDFIEYWEDIMNIMVHTHFMLVINLHEENKKLVVGDLMGKYVQDMDYIHIVRDYYQLIETP